MPYDAKRRGVHPAEMPLPSGYGRDVGDEELLVASRGPDTTLEVLRLQG